MQNSSRPASFANLRPSLHCLSTRTSTCACMLSYARECSLMLMPKPACCKYGSSAHARAHTHTCKHTHTHVNRHTHTCKHTYRSGSAAASLGQESAAMLTDKGFPSKVWWPLSLHTSPACTSHCAHLSLHAPLTACTSHCMRLSLHTSPACASHCMHLSLHALLTACTSHCVHLSLHAPFTAYLSLHAPFTAYISCMHLSLHAPLTACTSHCVHLLPSAGALC